MELMRDAPDNYWNLAIVDPPYGINMAKGAGETRGNGKKKADLYIPKEWDADRPDESYFIELQRVSENQVIWGGNYFADLLPPSRCWLYWQKQMGGTYSDGELAWTSFDAILKDYTKRPDQGNRIHPTQKPVKLYDWILANYASPGDRILDTHMGSGSIAIACHYFGAYLTATEIDEDYFKAACERIENETRQMDLFQENREPCGI
jgi:site-specific DNA-methyltransferase (adenine-specific)|tara:strand:+ start:5038 stop:5655 length:618 start_codon:yes stop_codon:yes gene_type:complete